MRRGESSNILFSLLLFLFIGEVQQAACSSSCGDIKDIRYPFSLKDPPAEFGDSVFELTCQSNKPILQYGSGKYYVKEISYDDQIIKVVDVNLANGSFGALPSQPLSFSVPYFFYDSRTGMQLVLEHSSSLGGHFKHYTEAQFLNCPSNFSHPSYIRVPCLSGNQCHVYVYYDDSSTTTYRPDSCSFNSSIPMLLPIQTNLSYETIQNLLQLGFDLSWYNGDCYRYEIFYGFRLLRYTLRFYCSKKSFADYLLFLRDYMLQPLRELFQLCDTADPYYSFMWEYYPVDALFVCFLWGN
ncbi:hypothetical protein Pint_22151 [Pistacia integerrima]|uniref:Uncharacterized protein n=1 Tax=Pistacia integerrima TaxID=434235 RepID=A0ACC0YNH3_9ROSI|nr:hypothetical protein Pint_22151 [Pistacia integerrima]